MRLTYDDYKKVQKNWNTKAIKTDCTTQFIYKVFYCIDVETVSKDSHTTIYAK